MVCSSWLIHYVEVGAQLITRVGRLHRDLAKVGALHHLAAIRDELLGHAGAELRENHRRGRPEQAAVGKDIHLMRRGFQAVGIERRLGKQLLDFSNDDAGIAVDIRANL